MRLCLFPTSGTMSQPVQEASEYICISLKGENEEMLQNQLTTSMCTCLSAWKNDTVVVCCQTGWLKNMCTFWNLPLVWCSAVTLELSMKHVKERSSQKLGLITDWLMNWACFHMQSCKHLREDAYSGNCVFCICFLMFFSQVLSLFLTCVCQGLYISG